MSTTLGTPYTATLSIHDNEATPSVSFVSSAYTVTENSASVQMAVSLNLASAQNITVDYMTTAGEAKAGEEYAPITGTLTFEPGDTEKTITVPILDDGLDEDSETFIVSLANAANATLGAATNAVVAVTDDDAPPIVSFEQASMTVTEQDEGNRASGANNIINVTVALSAPSGRSISVEYAASNGSAEEGIDYAQAIGTLNFNTW